MRFVLLAEVLGAELRVEDYLWTIPLKVRGILSLSGKAVVDAWWSRRVALLDV
jgi:hypothetical protein